MKKQNTSEALKTVKAELVFQNKEKKKRAAELSIAKKELVFQNKEKKKRAAELIIANKELGFQNKEKKDRAAELVIANKELGFQNKEKKNRAAELVIANKELVFQNKEKEKRAAELSIANKELLFQNGQKEKRAQELEIALGELVANEKRHNALIENSADAILILSETGKPTYVSSSIEKILGYTGKELMQMDILSIAHPDDLEPLATVIQQVLANPGVPMKGHTGRMRHKNGNWRWLEATVTNMLHDPAIQGIVDNLRDVTESKIAEEKINHLNRLYAFISLINQAIVHSPDEQKLFNAVCKIAVNVGKFKLALVGIVDEPNEKLNLVAEEGAISTDLELFSSVAYKKNGPVANLLQNGTLHAINNIAASDMDDRWKQYAVARGFQANIYLALKKFEKTTAIFTLISAEADFFNQEEIALLAQAADDISFALDYFEKEKQRLQVEEALRESESNLQAIFENTSEGFILLNAKGEIKNFNKRARDIEFQNTGEEIETGKKIQDFYRSKKSHYEDMISKVLSGETISYDHSYSRKNGEVKWYSWTKTPVYNQGIIEGICITSADITDRKNAEEKIRAEKNMLRTLIDNLPDAIYFKDASARKLISNKFDFNLAGKETEEEVLGKTDLELMPLKLRAICYEQDIEILRTGTPLVNFEEYLIPKNSKPRWLLTTKLPLLNEQNKIVGLLGIGRDITEKKMADEKLNVLNTELEKNVKKLEISNTELEQFAYVASHDLQEPLRMVTSFLTKIEKKYGNILDEKGRQYIHFAVDGAERMRQIILDLLEFSRVGQTEDKQEDVDMNELMGEILSLLSKKIEEKKAVIKVGKLPVLKTLRSPMRQVFQNLVNNSLIYHKKGGHPEININVNDKGNYWEFVVSDKGIGIDPDYFNKIFTLFQRLHNKDEYSGTGIGLSITKKILESMGGKIWVESEEGKGSSFYFTIKK